MPIVIRIPFGGGIGAVEHHSESPETLFAHVAGLKVVACSNAADAYTMIQQAVLSNDPIIFFEPKRRYWEKGDVDTATALADAPPLHRARVVRAGRHVTLLAYGAMVKTCLDAAKVAADEGHELEVVDVRSLSPIDWPTITESVRHTGRCVVVHEAQTFLGVGAELAAHVTESCFYEMQAPVLRVGGFATPYPPSRLEEHFLPDLDRVLDAVDRSLAY
jgi:pyruvate dehydrogenase E1 component beta subunit